MTRRMRDWRIWAMILGVVLTTTLVLWLTVFAEQDDITLTVQPYSNLVRFEAAGIATLQVQIYDLSGKKVWDSSVVSGDIVDWDRNNDFGERLAYGVYIYSAQGWNAQGGLDLQKKGKIVLMPGDKVRLQVAPEVLPEHVVQDRNSSQPSSVTRPAAVYNENVTISKGFALKLPSGGSDTHPIDYSISNKEDVRFGNDRLWIEGNPNTFLWFDGPPGSIVGISAAIDGTEWGFIGPNASTDNAFLVVARDKKPLLLQTEDTSGGRVTRISITGGASTARIGINTNSPSATLEVHGSETNLFALYDPVAPTDPKFRVEKTGTVHADGAYYGASYNTGSADVAERINTSEWVEPGDVVEIDPEHPGLFRKSTSSYSTKVAGIISTSPGVILGNTPLKEANNKWEDSRPVLAVTGRVPCKVSTENGPIAIGDLLVASSTPGVAMRADSDKAIGAVVGKAMEPLKEGEGTIVVQVMLR